MIIDFARCVAAFLPAAPAASAAAARPARTAGRPRPRKPEKPTWRNSRRIRPRSCRWPNCIASPPMSTDPRRGRTGAAVAAFNKDWSLPSRLTRGKRPAPPGRPGPMLPARIAIKGI